MDREICGDLIRLPVGWRRGLKRAILRTREFAIAIVFRFMPIHRSSPPGSSSLDSRDSSERRGPPPPSPGGDGKLPAPDALDDPESPHYGVGDGDESEEDEPEFKPSDLSIRERRDDA